MEVGCASGSMLAVMKDQGWNVTGIDLSERFSKLGKKLNNLDIIVADFLNVDFRNDNFDIIIMLGTVSNLQDFSAHIKHVMQNLRPGGYFYFNFPHAESLVSRVYGESYWMFTPTVSTFFTKMGMRNAL